MANEKPLRTNWTSTRTVRCTKGRTPHDIAHITTSTTSQCLTSSDITTRRHGVSPRFHNFDSFCLQPLQTVDRLAQSEVAEKLRSWFECLRCVLTWVGDAWRRAVGHILTWVGDAWRCIGAVRRSGGRHLAGNLGCRSGASLQKQERQNRSSQFEKSLRWPSHRIRCSADQHESLSLVEG